MSTSHSSKPVIITALLANFFIAIMKLIVAFFTGSSAMLAESIHSFADTTNQIFLLVGLKKAEKAPDMLHPFGFSGELYFWSFVVAIILFSAGGVFSIYEGIHKLNHPKPIENVSYAFAVLALSIIAEGIAFYKAFKKVNKERQELSIYQYLRKTKKSELLAVNAEFNHRLTTVEINNLIDGIEKEIHEKFPDVKKIFIEPDIYRTGMME